MSVFDILREEQTQAEHALHITLHDCRIEIRSNRETITAYLREYFAAFIPVDEFAPQLRVIILEGEPRNPLRPAVVTSVSGSPEVWWDEPGAPEGAAGQNKASSRIIYNPESGLLFAPGETVNLVVGPCLSHVNHLAKFICSRYFEYRLFRECVPAHAAAVIINERAIVLSAPGGGGKSTAALALLPYARAMLGNDRLALQCKPANVGPMVYGVPRRATIRPGTALRIPELNSVLDAAEYARYAAMPPAELRSAKQKYEISIGEFFRREFEVAPAPLGAVFCLNYGPDEAPFACERVALKDRPDLVAPLLEPEPVFRSAIADRDALYEPSAEDLLAIFATRPAFEIRGRRNLTDAIESIRSVADRL